jgi:hypothetical protein
MPGGSPEAYGLVERLFTTIAAQVDGVPCCRLVGPGGAGHYVKMVHNGIEYADMQLIAEAYDLLGQGLGMGAGELAEVLERWNAGDLDSFLIEITAKVLRKVDEATGEQVAALEEQLKQLNAGAVVVKAASPVRVEDPELVTGRRVLVIEDGPTLTHGEMSYGAGVVAARRLGAAEIVDPRPWLVGSLAEVYERYPHIGALVPAMGYSDAQIRELEAVINAAPVDAVVIGTPIDLRGIADIAHPATRVRYDLVEQGQPDLATVLAPIIRASAPAPEELSR